MTSLRRHLVSLVLAWVVLSPVQAFASGTPTPTPAVPPRANPTPLAPTPTRSTTTGPTSEPTSAPATSVPAASPVPTSSTAAPSEAPAAPSGEPAAAAPAAPSGEPAVVPSSSPSRAPVAEDAFTVWHGVVREAGAYRRTAPSSAADVLDELDPGTPIRVVGWVGGSMLSPDVITWGEVTPEDGGGYVFGGSLQGVLPPAVPPPPEAMQNSERTWLDVNLTLNVITVYEAGAPTKMMLTSPGRPGFQTDVGLFSVRTKLPSQTMTGPGYVVPGVPSVEYFYGGEAVHGRYWTLPDVAWQQTSADVNDDGQIQAYADSPIEPSTANRGVAFGVPSSHGCLGVEVGAAASLYGLTSLGTPVDVHY